VPKQKVRIFKNFRKNKPGKSRKPELKEQNRKLTAYNSGLVHFCTNVKFFGALVKYRFKERRKLAWCKNAPMVQKFAKFLQVAGCREGLDKAFILSIIKKSIISYKIRKGENFMGIPAGNYDIELINPSCQL